MSNQLKRTNTKKRFLIYHLPAILYAIAIIAISSIPHLKAPHFRFLAFDKLAHFVEYAAFSYLTFRSISNLSSKININQTLILSGVFLSFFAVFDELFQRLIPGRFFDGYDILTDLAGAFLVLLLSWVKVKRILNKID